MDNESHIDICDFFMLAVCLEDQENDSSPTELRGSLRSGRHERALHDEFPQPVEGEALHADHSS